MADQSTADSQNAEFSKPKVSFVLNESKNIIILLCIYLFMFFVFRIPKRSKKPKKSAWRNSTKWSQTGLQSVVILLSFRND